MAQLIRLAPYLRGMLPMLALACVALCACEESTPLPSEATPPPINAVGAAEQGTRKAFVGASHILVAYKDADRASEGVTRSKVEARELAEDVLRSIKEDGLPFEEAVDFHSDDEASKATRGALGNFEHGVMTEAFSNAAFAIDVGEISDVVETPRGFHIIKRTR